MKSRWTRRDFLRVAGATAAAGLWPGQALASRIVPRDGDALEQLAARLAEARRDEVLELVVPLLRKGLSWQELQGAVFLAGIREIEPRPVGFQLHAVLVVESVFQLAEASPPEQALLATLWNLDDMKNSQEGDRRAGDWSLPPAPAARAATPEAAARELTAALEARDEERADRAVVAAHAVLSLDELFELLWDFSFRDFSNLGHDPIFATHVARVLARLQGRAAQPALRSLVYGLLDGGTAEEDYPSCQELAPRLREGWRSGRRAPQESLDLARSIRSASPAAAREEVVERLDAGLDPASVWDGLRLAAADLFARSPGLLPVHPTTVTSALHHVFRVAHSDTTRRLALLQAASWLPRFRDALQRMVGLSMEEGGIDPLLERAEDPAALPAVPVEDLFAEPSRARALAAVAHLDSPAAFAAPLRAHLFRGVREHHEPKYAAAILEDAQSADPRWHPVLLASALDYLPSAATPTTAFHERARALVQGLAGV